MAADLEQEALDDHQYIVDKAAAALKAAQFIYRRQPLTRECLEDMERIRDDMRMLQAHFMDGDGHGQLTDHELLVMGRLEVMADDLITAESIHAKTGACGTVDTTPTALVPGQKKRKRRHKASNMAIG